MKLLPSKEQIPLVITLCAVIVLGLGYYFVYLPGNEKDLQQWKFRTLQNIDKNVHDKIDNGNKLLDLYLNIGYLQNRNLTELNEKLTKIKTDSFPIGDIKQFGRNKINTPNVSINEEKELILTLTKPIKKNNRTYDFQLSLKYRFDLFIKPLLPDKVFDNYIVIGKSGVLFESFPTGLDNSSDSLIQKPHYISSSKTMDREFGGIRYKLFIQPVNCEHNTRIIVIGLLTSEHYEEARSKLPPKLVLLLILIFTGILVTFPIIKLYQLGIEDRLTTSDALLCTIVSMLMVSLLFFSFLKFTSVYSYLNKNDPKEVLADTMSARFLHEIRASSEKVIVLDKLITKHKSLQTNIFNVGRERPYDIDSNLISSESQEINYCVDSIRLDRILWMDPSGFEINSWKSSKLRLYFPGKFGSRAYFRNIKRDQGYDLKLPSGDSVYLDQVISWVTGEFLSDISTRSSYPKASVVAMSFSVKSLDQVKVPPGYTFAVIDKDGKVLYHSNKRKNLNENLFEEFSNPKSLINSIKTGSKDAFRTDYFGHEYAVMVKATGGGLPYYIVIFDDLRFEESRDVDVHSFTFSMQMLVLILVVIQMLIVFFASAKRSVFKVQKFDTAWLSPKKSFQREYKIATCFNIWIFIVAILSFLFLDSIISRLFTLLFSITILPVVLNAIYFKKTYLKGLKLWSNIKFRAMVLSGLIPALLLLIGCILLKESRTNFLIFQMGFILLPAIVIFLYYHFKENLIQRKPNYAFNFTWLVFSWMLVVNGLPVLLFFTAAYNYDQHLIARYKQLELARKTVQDVYSIAGDNAESGERNKISGNSAKLDTSFLLHTFYRDLHWINDAQICTGTASPIPEDDSMAINVLNSFHVYDANSGVYNRDLNKMHSFDFSFFFNNLMKQVNEQSDVTETYFRLNNEKEHLKISSSNLNLRLPPLFKWRGVFAWVLLLLALTGLFFLIFSLINKLFSLKLTTIDELPGFTMGDSLENGKRNTFLIALPGSKIIQFIDDTYQKFQASNRKIFLLDMSLITGKDREAGADMMWNTQLKQALENKYDLILIKQFEYNFRDPYTSGVKLSALEKIIHRSQESPILIISAIRPATLINAMNDAEAREIDKHSIEKWQYMIGRFRIIIQGLQYKGDIGQEELTKKGLTEDAWIFNEQTSNYHYYYSIWQSLSREEKFLLFDLAEDGLVNSYDKSTICLLISKGIIIQEDGALRLFSKPFRNFVVTGIGDNETEKIMEKVNDNRNWNKIAMPLALVSLAIVAFILSSQNEASTKLITTLGALAAAVPTIINFLATLGGTATVKKA